MRRLWSSASLALLLVLSSTGCGGGGGIDAVAEKNRTFYAFDTASKDLVDLFERAYPPLDAKPAQPEAVEYRGVSVLAGHVHVSRPTDWVLRKASNEPGRRYVQYVSPKEYVVGIYEWPDHPDAPWREVLARYEDAAKAAKAELVEQRVPMATWNAQARAYVVRRRIVSSKAPWQNTSLELLARSDHRIILVQIVHQDETLADLTGELLRVIDTLTLD